MSKVSIFSFSILSLLVITGIGLNLDTNSQSQSTQPITGFSSAFVQLASATHSVSDFTVSFSDISTPTNGNTLTGTVTVTAVNDLQPGLIDVELKFTNGSSLSPDVFDTESITAASILAGNSRDFMFSLDLTRSGAGGPDVPEGDYQLVASYTDDNFVPSPTTAEVTIDKSVGNPTFGDQSGKELDDGFINKAEALAGFEVRVDLAANILEGDTLHFGLQGEPSAVNHTVTSTDVSNSYVDLMLAGLAEVDIPADGNYTLEISASDPVGNTSSVDSLEFTLDASAPSGTVNINAEYTNGADYVSSTSVTVGLTCDDGANPTASGCYEIIIDEGTGITWATSSGTESATLSPATPDGTKTVSVEFIDVAGNSATVEDDVELDTTKPVTSIDSVVDGDSTPLNEGDYTQNNNAQFSFSVVESGSGIASSTCELTLLLDNNGDPSGNLVDSGTCNSPKSYILVEGYHNVTIHSIDNVGNQEESPWFSWYVDTTAPVFTAPSDVRVGTTSTANANNTDIGIVPPALTDNLDPSPTFSNLPIPDSYPLGNTTINWTGVDAALNSDTQPQIVTVAKVNITDITVDGQPNTNPLWDEDELKLQGWVFGYFPGDEILVKWGNGDTTTIPTTDFSGNADDGATWMAFYNYTAANSRDVLTVNATLRDNSLTPIANSDNESITVSPHTTSITIDSISDSDDTDSIVPSVLWEHPYDVVLTVTDLNYTGTGTAPTSNLAAEITLDYTDSSANGTSIADGDLTDNGNGTATTGIENFVAAGPNSVGLQSVNATFAQTQGFDVSTNSGTITLSPHHTQTLFELVQDVDLTDGITPSVFWEHPFDVTINVIDLNQTTSSASALDGTNLNFTGTALLIQPISNSTTDPLDASSIRQITTLTANNTSSEGLVSIIANYTGNNKFINSTASNSTTITPHHTQTSIALVEDVDTTDDSGGTIVSVPWGHFFDVTSNIIDLNATASTTVNLNNTNINYTGTALLVQPISNSTTDDLNASSVSQTTTLTAYNIPSGGVGMSIGANYTGNSNFINSTASDSIVITTHWTELILNQMEITSAGSPITGAGILIDKNRTAPLNGELLGEFPVSTTVEGQTISYLEEGPGTGGLAAIGAITEGIEITHPEDAEVEIINCPTCNPSNINVLKLPINATLDFPEGTKSVNFHIQNTSSYRVYFEVFPIDGNSYPELVQAIDETSGTTWAKPDIKVSDEQGGIDKIKILNITATLGSEELSDETVGITHLTGSNGSSTPGLLYSFNFTEDTNADNYSLPFTILEGAYVASEDASSSVSDILNLTASFAGDTYFKSSTSEKHTYGTTTITVSDDQQGFGGTTSTTDDSGSGFTSTVCGNDADSDSLCNVWDSANYVEYNAGTTTKQKYNLTRVNSATGIDTKAFGGNSIKDVFVEIDYMEGHSPNEDAINDVIAAFANSPVDSGAGVNLHVYIDEEIDHIRNLNVWKDNDNNSKNDFNSIKANHFGTAAERVTVGTGSYSDGTIGTTGMFYTGADITHPTAYTGTHPITEGTIIAKHKIKFDKDPGTLTISGKSQSGEAASLTVLGGSSMKAVFSDTDNAKEKILTTEVPFVSVTNDFTSASIGTVIVTWSSSNLAELVPAADGPVEQWGDITTKTTYLQGKAQVYHYVVFGHNLGQGCGGSSGVAESPGNDVVIGLGCNWGVDEDNPIDTSVHGETEGTASTGSPTEQAGTFMHELGHNLGLLHGGPEKQASTGFLTTNAAVNCKPNYYSVMNYAMQTNEFNSFNLDYSHGNWTNTDLDESDLDENTDVFKRNDGSTTPFVVYGNKTDSYTYTTAVPADNSHKVDWNGDGSLTDNTSADINYFKGVTGCDANPDQVLKDNDDWTNLVYDFRNLDGGSFDGFTPNDEWTETQKAQAEAAQPDYYSGLMKHHTIVRAEEDGFANPPSVSTGNTFDKGDVAFIQFQLMTCNPFGIPGESEDSCIDIDKIVKEKDYYLDNAQESDVCGGEGQPECLGIVFGRDLRANIYDRSNDSLVATIDEFHEVGGLDGFYFAPWDTTDFEGDYEVVITDHTVNKILKEIDNDVPTPPGITVLIKIVGGS